MKEGRGFKPEPRVRLLQREEDEFLLRTGLYLKANIQFQQLLVEVK